MKDKVQSKLNVVKNILKEYGYTEDELEQNKKDHTLVISDLVIISYNEKDEKYSISFCSSSFALGAVQMIQFLNDHGINNISFLQNFFVTNDKEIHFGKDADEKFKEEMSRQIVTEFVKQKQFEFFMADQDDKTFH